MIRRPPDPGGPRRLDRHRVGEYLDSMPRLLLASAWVLGLAASYAAPVVCATAPADLMPGCEHPQGEQETPAAALVESHPGCGLAACPFPPSVMLLGGPAASAVPPHQLIRVDWRGRILHPRALPPLTPPPQA